ncbi:hypothetical protein N7488_001454 [Penicillium malachiteum]|nr:hypothetical protein N7488_001454 [Penicillium malachiteum]
MSRCHTPSCLIPNVFVHDKTPACTACGSSFSYEIASKSQASVSPPPPIPPDEPPGQLNLSWPPSIPYTRSGLPVSSREDGSSTIVSNEPSSLVYDRLSREEIRLARLSPSSDETSPIHISLEKRLLADSVVHEATSYMWGGEDGDYTPCKPIFIGSYWDVLFQTRNCHALLRTMRLEQESRLIWVDALCINQQDYIERGEQVANMSRIYDQCTQVFVYLGEDLVTPVESGGIVQQRPLHDLEETDHSMLSLSDILKRRYFSRI